MRSYWFLVATAAAVSATPALARDGALYVGGEVGAISPNNTDVDIGAVDNAVTLHHDYGYDAALFVGYDLGGFRLEAEAAYKKADLDSYDTLIRLPLEGPIFPPSRDAQGGSTSALSFMINGMADFGDDDGLSGFVGGGAGIAKVEYEQLRNFANATPFLDNGEDGEWGFAWQLVAGARLPVSDRVDLTAKYRFFNAHNIHGVAFNGAETDSRFRSHSILAGITFNFGGPDPQ